MKGFKKFLLSCITVFALCLYFSQTVNASEGTSYLYWLNSGETEAKWYIGDPVMGPEQEVSMAEMTESDANAYYITTTPTSEVITFLNGLKKAGGLTISNVGNDCQDLTFGTETAPVPFKSISIQDDDLMVTVFSEGLSNLFWQGGSITVYGDVSYMQLGTMNGWYATAEYEPNVTIYGSVDSLDWYRGSDTNYNSFRGTLNVSENLAEAKVFEFVKMEELGQVNLHTNNFQNATGTIINNGVLADSIVCTETGLANDDYTYRYTCYCWNGWSGNDWELYVFANETSFVGSKYLADFSLQDLPDDAFVSIQGTYGEDALVIPKSLHKLQIQNAGNVIVQGNVDILDVDWYQADSSLYQQNIDVNVSGNVETADIYAKEDSPVNVEIGGKVANGTYNYNTYFSDGGLIVEDGWLKVPAYSSLESAHNKDSVAYIKPTTDVLNAAANVSSTDVIENADGTVLATKKITMTITENTGMDASAKENFETQYDIEILGVLDVNLYSGYYLSGGYLYVSSTHDRTVLTELEAEIPLTFTIPADKQDSSSVFGIIREHDGIYNVLNDIDSNPTTVTVMTDKFSVYMLVKSSDTLPENGFELEEPSESDTVLIEAFVTRMYEQCLGRTPDQSGLEGWVGQLEGGYMNGAQIAQQFVFSNEMLTKNLSDEEFVKVLYLSMMGREADQAGLEGWVGQLYLRNLTRSEVTKAFVESVEFTEICQSYDILRGDYDASIAPIEQFVTRFYSLCLGRSADQPGLYGWVDNLKKQYMNGAQIANAFFFSEEFKGMNVTNKKYVELLYQTLMGRTPDAAGWTGWEGQLNDGMMNRTDIMKEFINSPEFTDICQMYGILKGEL